MYRIKLSPPESSGKETHYLKKAIDSNELSMYGSALDSFRAQLQSLTGSPEILMTSSGTAALHLALKVLGVGEGDSVICPSFTYVASANPIKYVGANPIFIDSESTTWNMNPLLLESSIEKLKAQSSKLKAIIAVHIYGMPCNIQEIVSIGKKYNIPIIEDAAEAIGSSVDGQHVGTFGDIGTLSFNGNKIITTSGGGAIMSNNTDYITHASKLASQAKVDVPWYEHNETGFNYQMGNVNAAIGLGQLEALESRIKRRREIWNTYYQEFKDIFEFQLPDERFYASSHYHVFANRWLTTILTDSFQTRENIRIALEKENIESRPLWKPMHLQPVFKNCDYYGGKVAEDLFNRGVCLPSGSRMSEEDVGRVISTIKQLITGKRQAAHTSQSPEGEDPPADESFSMHYGASNKLFEYARELRRNSTHAESKLWEEIQARKLNKIKFRRQHPIDKYIADFYSHELRYVIEVDGDYHLDEDQSSYDFMRDGEMKEYGIFVRRFKNQEIVNQFGLVLETILKDISERQHILPHNQ